MGQSKLVSPLGGQSVSGPQGYSLRGTIESLEGKIADVVSEISYHRQQLQIVKSESETSNQLLNMKIDEMRGRIEFESQKLQNNMFGENGKQDKVHVYLHDQMRLLNIETSTCNSQGMALNRRIEEIERMIGVQACVDERTGKSIF